MPPATHFRVYALLTAESRRKGENIEHIVEDVIAEGELDEGFAFFDPKGDKVTQVAFYAGEPSDDQVCVGRILNPEGGKVSVTDIPAEEPAPESVIIGGVEYKKI